MYSRTPVTRTLKGHEKQFELAGVWVIGVDWIFNLPCLKQKKKSTTKCIFKEQPQKSHKQGILPKKNLQIDGSFFAYHELFCVFGDFYASGTQDAKVTKSLLLRYQFRHSYSVLLRSVTVCTDTHPPQERAATPLGSMSLTLLEQWCGFWFYVTRKEEPDKWKCFVKEHNVFHPYPRRLEKITVCRGYYKGSTFFSVI